MTEQYEWGLQLPNGAVTRFLDREGAEQAVTRTDGARLVCREVGPWLDAVQYMKGFEYVKEA